jgi:hypothetical protein
MSTPDMILLYCTFKEISPKYPFSGSVLVCSPARFCCSTGWGPPGSVYSLGKRKYSPRISRMLCFSRNSAAWRTLYTFHYRLQHQCCGSGSTLKLVIADPDHNEIRDRIRLKITMKNWILLWKRLKMVRMDETLVNSHSRRCVNKKHTLQSFIEPVLKILDTRCSLIISNSNRNECRYSDVIIV